MAPTQGFLSEPAGLLFFSLTQAELTPLAPSREQIQGGKFFTFFYFIAITAKFSQVKFLLSVFVLLVVLFKMKISFSFNIVNNHFSHPKYFYLYLF